MKKDRLKKLDIFFLKTNQLVKSHATLKSSRKSSQQNSNIEQLSDSMVVRNNVFFLMQKWN